MASEDQPRPKKGLKERAKELLDKVFEALEDLLPAPEMVPIPIQGPRRRR